MTVVDDVKSRLDMLELVSGYVALQRSGNSYKANCPFHQEKTPSFYVFPDRQSWRCFGACATGGDAFSFVMRAENLEFGDALKRLAQQVGVTLPSREHRGDQQVALQINEAARDYFQKRLASAQSAVARNYLERRGLSKQSIEKFELGLSPVDGQALKNHLVKEGYSLEQLAQAGLARRGEGGQHRDLFRGRLMIPIRNSQGELGGFGSRALDDSVPKYLNSPRTPVFDKGHILYAMHLAREAARQKGMVIVEGYMDAIMAHQHGFNNVVASMGTALTEHQVSQVRRLTGKVTMALDPDTAGQQATLRSLESSWQVFQHQELGRSQRTTLFQPQEMPELKIAALPDGLDPDELIRRSPEEWDHLVENGIPLMDYLFTALASQMDLNTPQGKTRMVELLFPLIAAVPEATEQDHYFQRLAEQLEVRPETLQASIVRPLPARRNRRSDTGQTEITSSAFARMDRDPIEDFCLGLLLQRPELSPAAECLRAEHFRRLENRAIFTKLMPLLAVRDDPPTADVLSQIIDDELKEHLELLLQKKLPPMDHQQSRSAIEDTARRLEARYLRDLKIEEGLRFSEGPSELLEEPYLEVLDVNKQIKSNEDSRNWLVRNASHGR